MDFTTQSRPSAEDIRNQTKLVMQPFANWEEYLSPALSVAILGELVFISSTTDFFIDIIPPKDGYKHIKYPESFRACLMQVCYSGWCAFFKALKSMDQIRLHTSQVPDYVKKILFQDNEEVCNIADECFKLSSTTEEHFRDVIYIIQELLEACVIAEDFYGEEMEVMKKKIQENELRQQSAQETKENELAQPHESYQKSMDSLPSRWQKILAHVFDSKSKDTIQSSAISSKPPMVFEKENRPEDMSPSQRSTENVQFAIEQNRAQLNKARDDYDKYVEKNQKELTKFLVTMRTFNLKETDFKTIIEMLVKGMDAMGRVKEQLERMVHFFQIVSHIVKTSLSKTLTNFLSTYEKTQTLSYNAKLFLKDLLYTQAFQACNIASLVHMISGTYTDVSRKYLMGCVSLLGKLMTMDTSKPEFERECQMLQESCDAAQKDILILVLKNKNEFDRKCIERHQQIGQELLAILPAASPEETKRIQEAAQAGFSEEEEALYY